MKELIRHSKRLLKILTSPREIIHPQLSFVPGLVENPDADLSISIDILNEILNQNFPLETTVPVTDKMQVDISVAGAEIHMRPENEVELRITNAAIQYDQTVFKIGLHSNVVAVKLHLGIVKEEDEFMLMAHGWFSEFHIKYLPGWVASKIAETLTSKLLSPLLNIKVNEFLTLDKTFEADFITLKLALKPEMASVRVNEKGINLRVRFAKLVQSSSE